MNNTDNGSHDETPISHPKTDDPSAPVVRMPEPEAMESEPPFIVTPAPPVTPEPTGRTDLPRSGSLVEEEETHRFEGNRSHESDALPHESNALPNVRPRQDFELSDTLGVPLIGGSAAPLSSTFGLPTLIRPSRRREDDLADDETSVSLSSAFGLPLLSQGAAPFSALLRGPVLARRRPEPVQGSRKAASDFSLSETVGLPMLTLRQGTLSEALHLPTVLRPRERSSTTSDTTSTQPTIARKTTSEALGIPLLIDDPAPFSSALDLPTLVDEPMDPAHIRAMRSNSAIVPDEDRLWSRPSRPFSLTGREIAALLIGAALLLLPLAGAHH